MDPRLILIPPIRAGCAYSEVTGYREGRKK